jgi:hypothetical protein
MAALLLLGTYAPAQALPVAYQESNSGDLDGSQSFALDVGVNTIGGSICTVFDPSCYDFDSFSASIPASALLTDISLTYVLTGSTGASASWLLTGTYFSGPFQIGYADVMTANALGSHTLSSSALSSHVPQFPLTGTLEIQALEFLLPGTTLDYTWHVTVSSQTPEVPVPEPASLFLFGIGSAALAGTARVQRRHRREEEE